jgi:hypothetical protein
MLGPGAIVSSVRDANGKPVAGALVVADGPTTRQAVTSAAGIVTLLGLPLGKYVVSVTRSGFEPTSANVVIRSRSEGIALLKLSVAPATFADLSTASVTGTSPRLDENAPYAAQALTAAVVPDVVPAFSHVAPALEGTQPGETLVELDGIPIAGGPGGVATLRARNALQLTAIDVALGPVLPDTSVEGAIGGTIDYRTAPIATSLDTHLEFGSDSVLGAFEHARLSDTYGKIGLLADVVAGSGDMRSQTLKARLAFSSTTALDAALYGSQSTLAQGTSTLENNAPASALDLHTKLGTIALRGRIFDSEAQTTNEGTAAVANEGWDVRGLQLASDIPLGEDRLSSAFDRRNERAVFGSAPPIDETLTTLRLKADLQLSQDSRLELGDAVSGGTYVRRRNDPFVALALHPAGALTLRLAAGGAYATPLDVLGSAGPAGALAGVPETSFGLRASVDAALAGGDHARVAAFELRRYDTFSALSQARSSGFEFGYERQPLPGRLGVLASAAFTRTYAFGAPAPADRFAGVPLLDGEQLANDPFAKGRLAFAYRSATTEFDVGSTLLGANNALANHAVLLGDVSLRLSLASFAAVRLGIENLFGQTVSDPRLAPLYPPHEFTVTIGS